MNKYNNNYNNDYEDYNNDYDNYNNGYNDYSGYDYTDENLEPKKKGPKTFILIVIVIALIGVGGFYTYNAISSQLKPSNNSTQEVVEEEYDEEGNVIDKPNKEDIQEGDKEVEEEEDIQEDPTKDMTEEELKIYENEKSSTVTIGGEIIPLTDSAQIKEVKEIYNGNIEYILGNYFKEKVVGSAEKDQQIKDISKDIKEMLPEFKVNIQTKEQDSKISFVVKVDEVSFNETYKLDVIQTENVVDDLTPEERAKEEEAKKNLGNN